MWIVLWFIFSLIVGAMGSSTKLGFWGGFLISLFLSPVVGFIIIMVSGSNEETVKQVKTVAEAAAQPKKSIEARLFDLNELKEKRIITPEEYDDRRKAILSEA